MSEPTLRRFRRSVSSLHRSGMIVPVTGLAVMGASAWAMAAAAAVWPDAAHAAGGFGSCNPLAGDFGCGHGLGCACHLLPVFDPHI